MAVVDTSGTRTGTISLYTGTYKEASQSFTGNGNYLTSCVFKLCKVGAPKGTAYARLYNHSGVWGSTGVPSGAALVSSGSLSIASLTATLTDKTFDFAGSYILSGGSHYCIVFDAITATSAAGSRIIVGNANPGYHGGNQAMGT